MSQAKDIAMRDEYNFTNAVRNPYVKKEKIQITIRLNADTVDYFKDLSKQTNIPYQTLINAFLTDCVAKERKPEGFWE